MQKIFSAMRLIFFFSLLLSLKKIGENLFRCACEGVKSSVVEENPANQLQ